MKSAKVIGDKLGRGVYLKCLGRIVIHPVRFPHHGGDSLLTSYDDRRRHIVIENPRGLAHDTRLVCVSLASCSISPAGTLSLVDALILPPFGKYHTSRPNLGSVKDLTRSTDLGITWA